MSDKPGTFKPKDPRINRKGRPKVMEQLKGLTLDMFARPALDANGNQIFIEGKPVTIIELVMWRMIHSKDPREVHYAIEIAYGKVANAVDITSGGDKITWATFINDDTSTSS